jgi:hypothetical protein
VVEDRGRIYVAHLLCLETGKRENVPMGERALLRESAGLLDSVDATLSAQC